MSKRIIELLPFDKPQFEIKSCAELTNILKQNEECKLESNNKTIKVEENSKNTNDFHVKSKFVCYNVNVETFKDEVNGKKDKTPDVKLSKFKFLRSRVKHNKPKPAGKFKDDDSIQTDDTVYDTPVDDNTKQFREILNDCIKNIGSDDDAVNKKSHKPNLQTSTHRLLHSRLRPDTSQSSNLVIPDLRYTLSTDAKAIYPENDPPPVFKPYGPFKSLLPKTSSSGFTLQDKKLKDIKPDSSEVIIKPLSYSKLIRSRENTRYDILFGNLENYDRNVVQEDTPNEVPSRTSIRIIHTELNDVSDTESKIDITNEKIPQIEEPPKNVLEKKLSIDLDFIEDILTDLLIEIPPPEKEESVVEVVEIEEPSVENLLEEIPIIKSSIEIIPIIEILINEILKKESPISKKESLIPKTERLILKTESSIAIKESPIPKTESPVKEVVKKESSDVVIPMEEKVKETEVLKDSSQCNKTCKYKKVCDARRAANKIAEPNLDNESELTSRYSDELVILKECSAKMGSQIPIYKGRKRRKKIMKNVLEMCECKSSYESNQSSLEVLFNKKKKSSSSGSNTSFKCIIEDPESEELLQSYDFISKCGTQNYKLLGSTGYDLVLDLTFENTRTQTYNFTKADKSVQTNESFPRTSLEKEKLYMYVPKNNKAAKKFIEDARRNAFQKAINVQWINPKLTVINTSNRSYALNPNVEIIYQNKYLNGHQHHVEINPVWNTTCYSRGMQQLTNPKILRYYFVNPKVKYCS